MAEDVEDQLGASAETGGDPLAAHMAVSGARSAVSEDYLREQTALARLRKENLLEQNAFEVSHLRWRRFNDQMRGFLQLMVAMVGALIVIAIGAAVWRAEEADGAVIEAFSVPPDFAANGLTGEVVATKLQNKLTALQESTFSFRAPSSYANNWGSDIKVQIPDTGVSIGEFNRYLADWLGHETHIGGAIYRTPAGIAVTAQAGGVSSPTFAGRETDLDALIGKAAEAVYGSTQPYRYAIYLAEHGRSAEAAPIFQNLIHNGSVEDRSWAYIGLSKQADAAGDEARTAANYRSAAAILPDNVVAWSNLAGTENTLEHLEASLAAARRVDTLLERGADKVLNPYFAVALKPLSEAINDELLGDYQGVLAEDRKSLSLPDRHSWENALELDIMGCAGLHDPGCLHAAEAALPDTSDESLHLNRMSIFLQVDGVLARWQELAALDQGYFRSLAKLGKPGEVAVLREADPYAALAAAELGDFKSAHALIDKTPPDCDTCLRFRGRIDSLERNWRGAAYWFACETASAPSIPFAYTDWGAMLLAKGDSDAAIEKFRDANLKSPHFADPLEMWGEALIAKNRSDLALAKFAEADKYAPNWGRLHLKWGEALTYAGNRPEAAKQFALASHLDLSTSDRAALAHALSSPVSRVQR